MNLNVQKQPGKNSSDISFVGFIKKKKGIYIFIKNQMEMVDCTLSSGVCTPLKNNLY